MQPADVMLSPNFSLAELTKSATAEANGIDNSPEPWQLDNMRTHLAPCAEHARVILLNNSMLVSSGLRVSALNKIIPGSSDDSAHTKGYAIDFTCPKFGTPWDVCQKLVNSDLKFDQIIYESVKNRYGKLTIWVHLSADPRQRMMILTKLPGQPYRSGLHRS